MSELKSYSFPVWSASSANYEKGRYEPEIKPRLQGSSEVTIHHAFYDGGLIGNLLKSKQAAFGCIAVLPSTMYRRVFVAESHLVQEQSIECSQTVDYHRSGYGQGAASVESPMFRPIILAQSEVSRKISADADGLIHLWNDAEILIPRGSVIAYGNWERFGGICGGMFKLRLDKEGLGKWQMRVSCSTEEGFRFLLYAGAGLYDCIQHPPPNTAHQRKSVLTHAVSAALSLLKSERDSYDVDEYINLRLLAKLLQANGHGDWRDNDFEPEVAATDLYPHAFPRKEEDDD